MRRQNVYAVESKGITSRKLQKRAYLAAFSLDEYIWKDLMAHECERRL